MRVRLKVRGAARWLGPVALNAQFADGADHRKDASGPGFLGVGLRGILDPLRGVDQYGPEDFGEQLKVMSESFNQYTRVAFDVRGR